MEIPGNLRYTKEHEWVRLEDDGTVTIGISDYAQEQLGDIVYVELPEVGDDPVAKDEPFAVVESVKAVSDVYAPVSGVVKEVNDELPNSPEAMNQEPYGDGWLVIMELAHKSELDGLMSPEAYQELINELS
jgi:glycine cleavage system H protein